MFGGFAAPLAHARAPRVASNRPCACQLHQRSYSAIQGDRTRDQQSARNALPDRVKHNRLTLGHPRAPSYSSRCHRLRRYPFRNGLAIWHHSRANGAQCH